MQEKTARTQTEHGGPLAANHEPSSSRIAQGRGLLKFGTGSSRFEPDGTGGGGPRLSARQAGMRLRHFIRTIACVLVLSAAPVAAAPILFASGHWVALDRGAACEAASQALRAASRGRPQAIAGFAFDARGARNGQFFARLSRAPRPGSSIMLTVGSRPFLLVGRGDWAWSRGPRQEAAIIEAVRAAGGMRIEARDRGGRRFVDRYLLDGAPTAIDAAAAACAGKLVNERRNP